MKSPVVLLMILAILIFAPFAYAHPPRDIQITFDPKTKIIKAIIIHNVNNPLTHYINKVDIGLNGQKIIEQLISRQDNYDAQTVMYLIPYVKDGDVLSVEGSCSISGKLEKEIKVEAVK
jgi:hypothetical protein